MKVLRLILPLLCCLGLLTGCIGRTEYTEIAPTSSYSPPADDTANSTTTSDTTATTTAPGTGITKVPAVDGKVLLDVPTLCQFPDFPSGCEPVAAVMALKYSGARITVDMFVDRYLPCGSLPQGGTGPDPNEVFVGDPRSDTYAYGCLSGAIEKALITCASDMRNIVNTTGTSLDNLCHRYVDYDTPVMVWATIGMVPSEKGAQWKLEDGSTFTWPVNEHCLLLVGYDNERYYFNDPRNGKVDSCSIALARQRYEELGMQSLVITQKWQ